MARSRLDLELVRRGLFDSRAKARAAIEAGRVVVDGAAIAKPSEPVDEDAVILAEPAHPYVGRGALKLARALELWPIDVRGAAALDVGASTGGFTDCLLQRGAARVYAVDVGYGQLAEKLRRDDRVDVRERVNARDLQPEDFSPPPDLVVVDASFIGINKLIGPIARVLAPGGELCALVKPQFEAGREAASRGRGVIRDEETRLGAIAAARTSIEEAGFTVLGEVDSAVHGPRGNVERFVHARR